MNQPQEGAESILHYAKPTEPVNLTFWQTCKAHPWKTAFNLLFVLSLVVNVYVFFEPKKPYESVLDTQLSASIRQLATPESVQPPAAQSQPQIKPKITPKKIAHKAINTPASGANLPVSDDVLGDFIAELERKKANPLPKNKEPAPSASNLEQEFESRLFNFERKIP